MKNKNKIIAALICAAALSSVSCSSPKIQNPNDITANTDSTAENITTDIPDTDDDGNKITVIEVTENGGAKVTDENNNPVTELAIVDKSGSIITNAEGSAVKPNISTDKAKTTSGTQAVQTTTANSSGNNGSENNISENNGDKNNGSENNSSTENNGFVSNSDTKYSGMLWLAGYTSENGKVVFDYIEQDGQLIEVKVKISENAQTGNYKISCAKSTPSGQESNFVDNDSNSLNAEYSDAVIAVNGTAPENTISSDGVVFWLSNASAAPGETITIYGSISNMKTNLAAFNTYLAYDPSIFTIESITAGELIKGNGDFMS